jgi:Uma2 family endonuclease
MSTIDRARPVAPPPLVAGERLDREAFHERYEAMPPETRAELIGGVVHMPSPLSADHGKQNSPIAYWLGHYQRFTPGVWAAHNASVFLDNKAEPQPDSALAIDPACGGQTWLDRGYIAGAPELVVEIAKFSKKTDLGKKKDDYERAGVLEYVVFTIDPDEVRWFVRREGRLVPLAPGEDGLYRSEVFPGLWLDPDALIRGDFNALTATLELGLATPDHAAFVGILAARRGTP